HWQRAAFTNVELHNKITRILDLGKIGVLVAERLAAFGMTVIAYDPYVAVARASQVGVRLGGLPQLRAEGGFIRVHPPRTTAPVRLRGDRELHMVKPQVRIVNAARGGIVDEAALASAITEGRVAKTALDVYATKPPVGSPLLELDRVIVTPHLGASTVEAQ